MDGHNANPVFVSLEEMPIAEQLSYEVYTLSVMASSLLQRMESLFRSRPDQNTAVAEALCCYLIQTAHELDKALAVATRNKLHS